jgi:hypothetical protein
MVLGFGNKRMMSERELLILYPSKKEADGQLETKSVMPLNIRMIARDFKHIYCHREDVNKCNDIGYL